MKTTRTLNLLIAEEDKHRSEAIVKYIKSNVEVEKIEVQAIHDVNHIVYEILKTDVKPQMVILSEPSNGKMIFANEVPLRISQIKKISPFSEVVLLSAAKKAETLIEIFRSGVYDVVLKDEKTLLNIVNSIHRYLNYLDEQYDNRLKRELINLI